VVQESMAAHRVLQITDTHLRPDAGSTLLGVDTAESLLAVLRQALAEHAPDAILATGDLAHDDTTGLAYERYLQLVRGLFAGPLLHLPGNHDYQAPMDAALQPVAELKLGNWEVIGFDTHADGRVEAEFGAADLGHLRSRLAAATADHVLLACHHPPLEVGCPWLDPHRISRGRELLESCSADGRVRGLVFGHVHQEVSARFGPLAVLGTPSTCFQFAPGTARFTIDVSPRSGSPGYRWLELHADGSLRTEVRRLEGHPLNIDLSDGS
jgi:3',5'-cyclic-AMP phosphodiesterase